MKDEREEVIEKVLAALRRAELPVGLEARVAEGSTRRAGAAQGVEFRWREMLAGSAVAGVWWRGAVAGIMASMLIGGGLMLAGHLVRGSGAGSESVAREISPPVKPTRGDVVGVALREQRPEPCASSSATRVVRPASHAPSRRDELMQAQDATPVQPYGTLPLTPQERALVSMVRNGDAQELAILNPQVQEKEEAEESAQFQRFFAEPPPIETDVAATDGAATDAAEKNVTQPAGAAAATGQEPTAAAAASEPIAQEPAAGTTETETVSGGQQ